MNVLETMRLGNTEFSISRLGMGCWAIGGHGWGKVDDADSICAVRCALDNGVTFYDTADAYGLGKSEKLLADILGNTRKKVIIATKGGVRWDDQGKIRTDTSPVYLKRALENSLKRLKLDFIPLYYIHKPDGKTPIQESIAALERIREEGKIGAIGVANFNADQIKEALQVSPISAVQVRLNIFHRKEMTDTLNICREHNITLVAWGALGDGLLTGKFKTVTSFSNDDHRSRMSEFSGETFLKYSACVDLIERLASSLGHRVNHLALRWVLDTAPFVCSLFGAKTDAQVKENLGADGWRLTEETMEKIDLITAECWN